MDIFGLPHRDLQFGGGETWGFGCIKNDFFTQRQYINDGGDFLYRVMRDHYRAMTIGVDNVIIDHG